MNPDLAEGKNDGAGKEAQSPHYVGFFEAFNQEAYFEAHEILEKLWREQKGTVEGTFFKGLIQLAGAFVHIQRNRRGPALALFRLARSNLVEFLPDHKDLDVALVIEMVDAWVARTEHAQMVSGLLQEGHSRVMKLRR